MVQEKTEADGAQAAENEDDQLEIDDQEREDFIEKTDHVTRDVQAEADAILGRLKSVVTYGVEDRPAWHTTIILALQVYLA